MGYGISPPPLNIDVLFPAERGSLGCHGHIALQDGITGPVTMTTTGNGNFQPVEYPEYRKRLQTTPSRAAFVGTPLSEAQGLPRLSLPPTERTWQVCTMLPGARNGEKLRMKGCQPVTDPSGCPSPHLFRRGWGSNSPHQSCPLIALNFSHQST